MMATAAYIGHLNIESSVDATLGQAHLMHFAVPRSVEVELNPRNVCSLYFCLSAKRESHTELRFSEFWPRGHYEPAGQLFMRPPGQHLNMKSAKGAQRAIACSFQTERLLRFFDSGIRWNDPLRLATVDLSSRTLRALLYRLVNEMAHPGFASELLCDALVTEIAVELQRHFHGLAAQPDVERLAGWRLNLIESRVRQEGPAPTLLELAELCGVSVRQVSRTFQAARGQSLGRYVAGHKMEQAKERLGAGEAVKSVAYGLGFSSPASFGYAFRQATGMTPGDFGRRTRQ